MSAPAPLIGFSCCGHCSDRDEHHGGHEMPCEQGCNLYEVEGMEVLEHG